MSLTVSRFRNTTSTMAMITIITAKTEVSSTSGGQPRKEQRCMRAARLWREIEAAAVGMEETVAGAAATIWHAPPPLIPTHPRYAVEFPPLPSITSYPAPPQNRVTPHRRTALEANEAHDTHGSAEGGRGARNPIVNRRMAEEDKKKILHTDECERLKKQIRKKKPQVAGFWSQAEMASRTWESTVSACPVFGAIVLLRNEDKYPRIGVEPVATNHWLFMTVNVRRKKVVFYNSDFRFTYTHPSIIDKLEPYLAHIAGDILFFEERNFPQQPDGYSCGFFAAAAAMMFASGQDPHNWRTRDVSSKNLRASVLSAAEDDNRHSLINIVKGLPVKRERNARKARSRIDRLTYLTAAYRKKTCYDVDVGSSDEDTQDEEMLDDGAGDANMKERPHQQIAQDAEWNSFQRFMRNYTDIDIPPRGADRLRYVLEKAGELAQAPFTISRRNQHKKAAKRDVWPSAGFEGIDGAFLAGRLPYRHRYREVFDTTAVDEKALCADLMHLIRHEQMLTPSMLYKLKQGAFDDNARVVLQYFAAMLVLAKQIQQQLGHKGGYADYWRRFHMRQAALENRVEKEGVRPLCMYL